MITTFELQYYAALESEYPVNGDADFIVCGGENAGFGALMGVQNIWLTLSHA
jgi:hypothetical protein